MAAYWEGDDTGAEEDVTRLEKTLQGLFGITTQRLKIPKSEPVPHMSVSQSIAEAVKNDHGPIKLTQTLFIFAYIGHATVDNSGGKSKLVFVAGTGQRIRWNDIKSMVNEPHVDFLAILDCCNAGLKEPRAQLPQTVQVLAGCGPTEESRARKSRITFTQRLCGELDRLQAYKETSITTELLFERLRVTTSPNSPNPRLLQLGGIKPIVLKLNLQRPASPSRLPRPTSGITPKPDAQHILVRLTLAGPESQNTAEFQKFVLGLPSPFHIRLVDAFKTDKSVLILARMRWQTWARISTVVDLDPIGVVTGDSLLREAASEVRRVGENMPIRPSMSSK